MDVCRWWPDGLLQADGVSADVDVGIPIDLYVRMKMGGQEVILASPVLDAHYVYYLGLILQTKALCKPKGLTFYVIAP